jgi:phosphohistidine phosphatase SixA
MLIRAVAALLLLTLLACAAPASRPATSAVPAAAPDAAQVAEQLRQGGYIIFVRHAATNRQEEAKEESMKASGRFAFEDCATQRNLSEAGRGQAERLGAALAALDIPISRVAASLYCRCQETAKLAFGWAEPSMLLTAGEGDRAEALRTLLAVAPLPGNNTVLVGHSDMMRAGFGVDLREAEAAILKPDRGGKPVLVAQLSLDAWEALVPPAP